MTDVAANNVNFRDLESLLFFHGVCTRDATGRSQALDTITQTFEGWLEGYGSPPETIVETQNGKLSIGGISNEFSHLISEHLPDLLRLAYQCPFQDVRQRCLGLLLDMQVRPLFASRAKPLKASVFNIDL